MLAISECWSRWRDSAVMAICSSFERRPFIVSAVNVEVEARAAWRLVMTVPQRTTWVASPTSVMAEMSASASSMAASSPEAVLNLRPATHSPAC